jgi:hypothetical protein
MKKFIANGRFFSSYQEVEKYAAANGWEITHTEVIKGKTLCHLSATL